MYIDSCDLNYNKTVVVINIGCLYLFIIKLLYVCGCVHKHNSHITYSTRNIFGNLKR